MKKHDIVIADTSCLIVLEKINLLTILKKLFSKVYITPEVLKEFGNEIPPWIHVKPCKQEDSDLFSKLGKGEASSIVLAKELEDVLIILDDKKARGVAQSHHLAVFGTLGVLLLAYKNGLITDFLGVIDKLQFIGFRVSDHLLKRIKKLMKNIL